MSHRNNVKTHVCYKHLREEVHKTIFSLPQWEVNSLFIQNWFADDKSKLEILHFVRFIRNKFSSVITCLISLKCKSFIYFYWFWFTFQLKYSNDRLYQNLVKASQRVLISWLMLVRSFWTIKTHEQIQRKESELKKRHFANLNIFYCDLILD